VPSLCVVLVVCVCGGGGAACCWPEQSMLVTQGCRTNWYLQVNRGSLVSLVCFETCVCKYLRETTYS
jgi:hypothetical protein